MFYLLFADKIFAFIIIFVIIAVNNCVRRGWETVYSYIPCIYTSLHFYSRVKWSHNIKFLYKL